MNELCNHVVGWWDGSLWCGLPGTHVYDEDQAINFPVFVSQHETAQEWAAQGRLVEIDDEGIIGGVPAPRIDSNRPVTGLYKGRLVSGFVGETVSEALPFPVVGKDCQLVVMDHKEFTDTPMKAVMRNEWSVSFFPEGEVFDIFEHKTLYFSEAASVLPLLLGSECLTEFEG